MVWNGERGDQSADIPRKLIMRELVPVAIAMFLDPRAYGRQELRHTAPTIGGERVYSHPLTGDWFASAEASARGKQIVAFDGWWDETVIEMNGKRYKPYVPKLASLTRLLPAAAADPSRYF